MSAWQNRITRYSEEAPDQLLANPANWRTHPGSQADALRGVLESVGVVQNVIANERTGYLIDGHLRVMEALKAGQPSIPVTWVDLAPDEEALVLATLDPLSAMAGTDTAQLDALLRDVSTDSPAVAAMLDALAQEAGIVPGIEPGAGGDEFDPTPEEGPTRCQPGDLWAIGGVHRLIIGDSTDPATVARLMGGERLRLVWTDPPYGVNYADKNEFLNALNRGNSNQTPIEHDHMSEVETEELCRAALALACEYAEKGAALYVACPAGTPLPHFIGAVSRSGFSFKHSLVWVKNQFVLGRCDYHYKHEVILYGWIENGAHYFVDDHTKFSVFEVDKPRDSDDHPTMKPVELIQPMVENSARRGEVVYDPFGGSGSTLIASHRAGRRAYLCELEPRYGDVILRRAEAEGLTVERASDA